VQNRNPLPGNDMSPFTRIRICICFIVWPATLLAGELAEPVKLPVTVKTSPPPTRQLKGSYFGINGSKFFHIPDQQDTVVKQRLEWMERLGIDWDRCDLWWHVVEPKPGQWNFSRSDQVFDALEAAGVQWYPILCYGANWFPAGHNAPLTDPEIAGFTNYVQQVVRRYRGRAPLWSVWNEPNISEFWNPTPDAAAYMRLLKAAYQAIKSADPEALVAAPAIAPLGPWDRSFVEGLYRHDFKRHYDVFDYHYYRNTAPEGEVPAELAEIQAVMRRNSDSKPIIISESGVSTLALINQGLTAQAADQRQAALVVRNQLLCLALGVERFFYFDLQNWYDDRPSEWGSQLGLVTAAGKPKPAFEALKTLIKVADEQRFVGRCHDLADGIEGVLIHSERDDCYLLALWSTQDGPQEIDVVQGSADAWLIEPFGQRKPLKPANNSQIRIRIDSQPRFVFGVDPLAYCRDAGIDFSSRHTIGAPGETWPLTLTCAPELREIGLQAVSVDAPAGLAWDPARGLLTVADDVAPGRYTIKARIALEGQAGEPQDVIERQTLVEVIANVDVSLLVDSRGETPQARIRIENRTDQALIKPLRIIDEISGSVVCDFGSLTVSARQVHEADYPITREVFTAVDRVAAWRASYGTNRSRPLRVLSLRQQTILNPVIDGELEEWQSRPAILLDEPGQVFFSPQPWREEDISGRFWLEFGPDELVLAASVQDDDPLFNRVSPGEMWQADSVEFFLGVCGPTLRGVIKPGCEYQIGIAPTTRSRQPAAVWFHVDRHLSEAQIAVKRTSTGYDFEAAIPYGALEIDKAALDQMGLLSLSVNLNDHDGSDFAPAGVRPGMRLSWNGSGSNWINPQNYGILVLR
jgi:hypothetical protein